MKLNNVELENSENSFQIRTIEDEAKFILYFMEIMLHY